MAKPSPRGPRPIRRYENRKLYDANAGRYVTLDELRADVAAGADLEVVDQKTGEDLTTLTLAQVLIEGLRSSSARVPRQVLSRLIRLAFGPGPGARNPERALVDAGARARQEAERIVGGLMAKGRLTLEEAMALRHELSDSVHEIVSDAQAGVEAGLRALFGPGQDGPHASLAGLKGRLDALGARVERGEARPRRAGRGRSARTGAARKP